MSVHYQVTEQGHNEKVISNLVTSSIWIAVADFILKCKYANENSSDALLLPFLRSLEHNEPIIFSTGTFFNGDAPYRLVELRTLHGSDNRNLFIKEQTDSHYMSNGYQTALSKISNKVFSISGSNFIALPTLIYFAVKDSTHPIWPESDDGKIKLAL